MQGEKAPLHDFNLGDADRTSLASKTSERATTMLQHERVRLPVTILGEPHALAQYRFVNNQKHGYPTMSHVD